MQGDPIAYFITFTTYGTWLRGDERGSVDKHRQGILEPNERLFRHDQSKLKNPPVYFNEIQRQLVDRAIREVCEHRNWNLHKLNVRTNHVHVLVTASVSPDKIMGDFKSYATRRLRENSQFATDAVIWTERGSRRWINEEDHFRRVCEYIENQ